MQPTSPTMRSFSETLCAGTDESKFAISPPAPLFTASQKLPSLKEYRVERVQSTHCIQSIQEQNRQKFSAVFLSPRQKKEQPEFFSLPFIKPPQEALLFIESLTCSNVKPYLALCISDLHQINQLYYLELIQKKVNIANSWQAIRKKMQSNENPMMKLILMQLSYFQEKFKRKSLNPVTHMEAVERLFEVINAIVQRDTDYFSLTPLLSHAEFLHQAFVLLDFEVQQLISKVLFDDATAASENFLQLLGFSIAITPEKIAMDQERIEQHKRYSFHFPADYVFEEETIIRCFIPDQFLILDSFFLNKIPIDLNQFTGDREKNFYDFFSLIFEKVCSKHPDKIPLLIDAFYAKKKLPLKLKQLLGISTVSARLLAYQFLDERYPLLKTNQITYRPQKKVKLFYEIDSHTVSCAQPLTLTIYRKLHPEDPTSYAIEESSPLATCSFLLTCYLTENGTLSHNTLQFQNFDYYFTQGKPVATLAEQELMERALKLKKNRLSSLLHQRLNRLFKKSSSMQ